MDIEKQEDRLEQQERERTSSQELTHLAELLRRSNPERDLQFRASFFPYSYAINLLLEEANAAEPYYFILVDTRSVASRSGMVELANQYAAEEGLAKDELYVSLAEHYLSRHQITMPAGLSALPLASQKVEWAWEAGQAEEIDFRLKLLAQNDRMRVADLEED